MLISFSYAFILLYLWFCLPEIVIHDSLQDDRMPTLAVVVVGCVLPGSNNRNVRRVYGTSALGVTARSKSSNSVVQALSSWQGNETLIEFIHQRIRYLPHHLAHSRKTNTKQAGNSAVFPWRYKPPQGYGGSPAWVNSPPKVGRFPCYGWSKDFD